MVLLRRLLGDVLRRHRVAQSRTLRDVSAAAGVSLGYLSEVERGRKEASSELLAAICGALDVELSDVLRELSEDLARIERRQKFAPVGFAPAAAGHAAPLVTARPVRHVAGIAPLQARQPVAPVRPRQSGRPPAGPARVPSASLTKPSHRCVAA